MAGRKRGPSLVGVTCDIDGCKAAAKRYTDFGRLCTRHYKRVVRNGIQALVSKSISLSSASIVESLTICIRAPMVIVRFVTGGGKLMETRMFCYALNLAEQMYVLWLIARIHTIVTVIVLRMLCVIESTVTLLHIALMPVICERLIGLRRVWLKSVRNRLATVATVCVGATIGKQGEKHDQIIIGQNLQLAGGG